MNTSFKRALFVFGATVVLIMMVAAVAFGVAYEGTLNANAIDYGLQAVFSGVGGLLLRLVALSVIAGFPLLTGFLSRRRRHGAASLVTLVALLVGALALALFNTGSLQGGPFVAVVIVAALFTTFVAFVYDNALRERRQKWFAERKRRKAAKAAAAAVPEPAATA